MLEVFRIAEDSLKWRHPLQEQNLLATYQALHSLCQFGGHIKLPLLRRRVKTSSRSDLTKQLETQNTITKLEAKIADMEKDRETQRAKNCKEMMEIALGVYKELGALEKMEKEKQ